MKHLTFFLIQPLMTLHNEQRIFSKMKQYLLLIISFSILNWQNAHSQIGLKRQPIGTSATPAFKLNYAQPTEYEIGDVVLTGTKFLDATSLLSITGLKQGDRVRIPGPVITDCVKKLMNQGILEDVQVVIDKVEDSKVWLNVMVKERPRLLTAQYDGVRKGEAESLNEKIKLTKGRIITDVMRKNAELGVRKYFQEKGFRNIKVNTLIKNDTLRPNQAYLKFFITKGEKVKINQIIFEGRTELSESTLRRKLKSTKQKRFGRIFTPSKFVSKKFEEDKEKLIEFYNKKGYRDARITFDTIASNVDNTVSIKIKIDEGRQYHYRNITWEGNYIHPDSLLSDILGIKKGDVYSPEELNKKLNGVPGNDVSSLYMDDGYLFFQADPEEASIVGDSIDIAIRINEGKQATISKIILNGNTKTNDHVVMREIRTLPGQKFSKTLLIRTQRELSQLGYFDPEKIGINPVPHADGTVDIEYTVVEKPSDQIELSGGWGGYVGFIGTLGLVFNNFSARNIGNLKSYRPLPAGDGQRLALRFQANGKQFQNYSVTFTEPWLGGKKPQSFGISINRSVYNFFNTASTYNPYGSLGGYGGGYGGYGSSPYYGGVSLVGLTPIGHFNTAGVTFSLGRRLKWPDDFFTLSNALSFSLYDVQNAGYLGSYYPEGKSTNITFNTTISRNSIDNPQFPRGGSSFTLSATFTPPYSVVNKSLVQLDATEKNRLVEYYKFMFDASWFKTVVGKLVLSTRAHMGFLGSYNSSLGIGPFERFVLGGSGMMFNTFTLPRDIISLRGYKDQVLNPRDAKGYQGGIAYNKFVAELRYPVSLNPSATIFLLGFAEAGNNWSNYSEFKPFDLKRSAGVGARIFMPAFGMIGIDWGYGFDTIPYDVSGTKVNGAQFHFSIGQVLR
jgi:outer membrane protein insertion porin family